MIEQINIALEQKGSRGISQPWVIEACRRRLTSEREHMHQLKVMKNEHPVSSLRTGRYCRIHLITRALQ